MQITKKPISVLETIALGYLFIPIFVFMLSWIKLWISIPLVALILIVLCKTLFDKKSSENDLGIRITPQLIIYSVICFVLVLLLSYYIGEGGFTPQPFDSIKHNYILKDLIDNSWPVRYELQGEKGVLCYYIAGYLMPALFGKLTSSFDSASTV